MHVARSANVLKEVPFKPKIDPSQPVKVIPFALKLNERVEQRRLFDENFQRDLTMKKEKVSLLFAVMFFID